MCCLPGIHPRRHPDSYALSRHDGWLACFPYRRFTTALTDRHARLGADADRYSFITVDLHYITSYRSPGALDSSVSPTHGEQEHSMWNGHFGCTCYHPLFVFNQFGDLERCALRPGNVHSADGWEQVLKPVIARY